jgi:SAM-dependent methyltransferase
LSLAAGPALEILEILKKEKRNDLSFTALDHDIETLVEVKKNDAENEIKYGIANAFSLIKGNKTVLFPRQNLGFVFNPPSDTKGLRKLFLPIKYSIKKLKSNSFDFIYSAGLYDYIQSFENTKKGTKALTKELFGLLKPCGTLLIGNFSNENPVYVKWVMEFICNWNLIYREPAEILDFASAIPDTSISNIEIIKEATGINYFLKIVKKQ